MLICGDFQSIRDAHDMQNMACPDKYLQMGEFHEYFSGVKKAPYLTIFIGGNHEASNYLQELYFGGWVAENIYYLGHSAVLKIKKGDLEIRLGGISGIFNEKDFFQCRKMNRMPFDGFLKRRVYHTRELEILKLGLVFLLIFFSYFLVFSLNL